MKNISSFWSIFFFKWLKSRGVFRCWPPCGSVAGVAPVPRDKNKMAASGGAGGGVPPPVWWKQTHLRCLLTKTQVFRVLPVKKRGRWRVGREGNSQKGGLSPEGQSGCEIQQKVKVWKLFYPRKEATKERVTRECHVWKMLFLWQHRVWRLLFPIS